MRPRPGYGPLGGKWAYRTVGGGRTRRPSRGRYLRISVAFGPPGIQRGVGRSTSRRPFQSHDNIRVRRWAEKEERRRTRLCIRAWLGHAAQLHAIVPRQFRDQQRALPPPQ